jgi:hypothetical protein
MSERRTLGEALLADGWLPVTHAVCGQLFGWIAASPRDYDVEYDGFRASIWPLGEDNHRRPDGTPIGADDIVGCPACGESPPMTAVPFRRKRDGTWWAL